MLYVTAHGTDGRTDETTCRKMSLSAFFPFLFPCQPFFPRITHTRRRNTKRGREENFFVCQNQQLDSMEGGVKKYGVHPNFLHFKIVSAQKHLETIPKTSFSLTKSPRKCRFSFRNHQIMHYPPSPFPPILRDGTEASVPILDFFSLFHVCVFGVVCVVCVPQTENASFLVLYIQPPL